MFYSGKRLRTKGEYCLVNLESIEILDAFISEVSKTSRLWIGDLNVFATAQGTPSIDDYIHFKCDIDSDSHSQSSQRITFYGMELTSLTSTIERVLCLPDANQERTIGFSGQSETYEDLILTPEQLHHVLCAHESRTYSFWYLNLSPEQSVVLAAETNLEGIWFCSLSDKGVALVDWLEHHNETRTLGSFSCQYYGAWENILQFTGRSSYPVFHQLVFDQFYNFNSDAHRYDLVVNANVNSILVIMNPYSFAHGECEVLLQALGYGTLVSPKLEFDFDADSSELDERLELFEIGLDALFGAISSSECKLKELHLKMETVRLGSSALVFEDHITDMLQQNKNLESLGLNSTVVPLQFPAIGILNAAAKHPRLRQLIFTPPTSFDPPELESFSPFQAWLRTNVSHRIRFDDRGNVGAKRHKEKWQDYIFFSRFGLLQQVRDERFRSHSLVMALTNHSYSPQRVHFLLSWNVDVFAK